jgi:geranylgeranyl pyrophosphate synthase
MADNLSAMGDVDQFLTSVKRTVEDTLDSLVPAAVVEPRRLHEAIRWSLFAGGKRIRPAIVFATGQAFCASMGELTATAAAIEMIHTYSLIHDDLPAMDDDDLRRGKPTCHKQFDEATAILAGDVLQTLAFKAIADDGLLPPEKRVEIMALIASAAGTPNGMVAGQQLDLDAEGRELTIDQINMIHRSKTGALISASAMAGALIGGASLPERSAVSIYADKLGLLFQVTDDLLDVTEVTALLGKTAGKDASSQKATYPQLLGVERSVSLANTLCSEACQALTGLDRNTGTMFDLASMVLTRRN